jgi:hypothetical protein
LLQDEELQVFSGTQPLLVEPITVGDEDAEMLWEQIMDPNRDCPLVFVSRIFPGAETALSGKGLALALAGVATVHVAETSWLDKETERVFKPDYRCWNGKVRIYLPKVRPDSPGEYRRHRYYDAAGIESRGEQAIVREILRSLSRGVVLQSRGTVKTIDDVESIRQRSHLLDLRRRLEAADQADYLKLLKELNDLNEAAAEEWKRKFEEMKAQKQRIEDEAFEDRMTLEDEIADKEKLLNSERFELNRLRNDLDAKSEQLKMAQEKATALQVLQELPSTAAQVLSFFRQSFSDRIVFTERGMRGSEAASYSRPNELWKVMWALSNPLHSVVFDECPNDLEAAFQKEGVALAMTETSNTKKDNKLMRQREDQFNGKKIDITPHLKLAYSPKNEFLRIHFCIDRVHRKFVIGEVTDHLDTAGTRRKK